MSEVTVIGAGDNGGPQDIAYVQSLSSDKVRAVLTLWTSGANYAEIATALGMRSPAVVQIAIERALAEIVDDTTDRPMQRRKMSLILERLMKATMTKAVNPENPEQLQAVRTITALVERYSRLNNLDAPQEITVHMPGAAEFSTFIEAAARGLGMEVPVEADIFSEEYMDADIVEDEVDGDEEARR
jgi:hypothetical protein